MPAVALERTRALDDTDGATRQTVQKMCELIRDSAKDPYVQHCAAYARDRFGMGSSDPAALVWGVFWYVKHCVKFRLDEGTMFQIGERVDQYGQQQQDLLIAPAVLVRMKNPSEDCDGFTMLSAAMLTCLGVRVLIATVATEPDDPSRWSHVFLCAIINGRVMPLDTSHGKAPGWMVPRNRINRWQTWTLDGRPADVSIPSYQGLHAYKTYPGVSGLGQIGGARSIRMPRVILQKRGRGFGQDDGDDYSGTVDYGDIDLTGLVPEVISPVTDANGNAVIGLPANVTSASITAAAAAGNCWDLGTGASTSCPSGTPAGSGVSTVCPSGYTLSGGVCVSTGAAGGATATPNWGAVASSIAASASQDIKAVIQQPQALLSAQTWANLAAYLPILGISVLGVWALTSVLGSKK
jgi:hypothetical protein